MKNIKKILLFGAIFCTFLFTFDVRAAQLPQLSSLKKINEKCQRDKECVDNGYCDKQEKCSCDNFYFHAADLSFCHAAAGLPCQFNDACNTMVNGECGSEKKCACKKNYILDNRNSSNCFMKPARDDDFCQETQDCVETIGPAICINNKCKCLGSHRFVNETGKCILNRGLFSSCEHDWECYDRKENEKLYCINRECALSKDKNDSDEGTSSISSPVTIGLGLILCIYSLYHQHFV